MNNINPDAMEIEGYHSYCWVGEGKGEVEFIASQEITTVSDILENRLRTSWAFEKITLS